MNLVLPQLLLDCGHPWSQRVTRPQRVWLVSVLELSLSHLPSPRTTAAVTSQQRASADTAGPSLHPLQGPTGIFGTISEIMLMRIVGILVC